MLLPGFLASILLHPYQYVFYNGLVGWTGRIHNHYEADYWGTSMCAAARYLDPVIDQNTRIYFTDENLGRLFDRCTPKSPVLTFQQGEEAHSKPDYAVILARWEHERTLLPDMEQIYSIHIGSTPLVVIRKNLK